jgi:hypothetical protein
MKNILIRKNEFGFRYCTEQYSTAPTWRYFNEDVKTAADMKKYFAERLQLSEVKLDFVDSENKPTSHYNVKFTEGLPTVIIDYDRNSRLAVHYPDLMSPEDQLQYLKENAISLPDDIDDLSDAVSFLKEHEPTTIEVYNIDLKNHWKEGVKNICEKHAARYGKSAAVAFDQD